MRLEIEALAFEELLAVFELEAASGVEWIEEDAADPHDEMPRQAHAEDWQAGAAAHEDVNEAEPCCLKSK